MEEIKKNICETEERKEKCGDKENYCNS